MNRAAAIKKTLSGIALSLLVVLPGQLLAQDVEKKPYYVGADAIKPSLLVAPLSPDSREYKSALTSIKQNNMADLPTKRLEEAKTEINLTPQVFATVLGEKFNQKNLPITFAFLNRLAADMNGLVSAAQVHWKGPHPNQVDPTIKPALEDPDKYGYPSRHTALTRLWAHVLADIAPSKYAGLIERAHKIAWNRVAVAVSFAYDLRGGDHLTYLMLGALQTNEQYRKDLAAAKAEMQKAGLAQ